MRHALFQFGAKAYYSSHRFSVKINGDKSTDKWLVTDTALERRYNMYSRLRQYHLIGAIGGFLTVLSAIIGIAIFSSYYIPPESLIIVGILGIAGDGLIVSYFAGVFSVSRDSLIKTGSLIAGIGLGWNILIAILQLAGVYFFVLALLGVLVTIAGEVIVFVKLITLFQRDSLIVVFCIFVLLGLLLSLFWIWASIISGAGLGSLLIYFYTHNITY